MLLLRKTPNANNKILCFIKNFRQAAGSERTSQEAVVRLFRKGYCYYFACILKNAFPEGIIVWDTGQDHIVFQYQGQCYDIGGVYEVSPRKLVPISKMGKILLEFQHIPGRESGITEQEICQFVLEHRGQ